MENTMPDEKQEFEVDTLVVVSKLKNFIRENSGMNSSQCFIDAMTQKICKDTLSAIQRAKEANRKTVMGKDLL